MKKIIIYGETDLKTGVLDDAAYELISKAVKLSHQSKDFTFGDGYFIELVAIGPSIKDESLKKAYQAGADKVALIKDEQTSIFSQIIFSKYFVEYFNTYPAEIIIFPATLTGRILAPRITTMLDTGLVADCTDLELIVRNHEIKLAATRPTFGSELMATILCKTNPQCATIRPGVFKPEFFREETGEFTEFLPTSSDESPIKLLRKITDKDASNNGFSDAKIVLCAGWGLYDGNDTQYFDKLQKLAKIVGAKYGATRKVIDFKLAEQSNQIGQTGSSTQADLYIAFGVSGAIQHIMGMKNAKTVIAINKDENAEIFKYADYKVVGDAKKIVDELYKSFA